LAAGPLHATAVEAAGMRALNEGDRRRLIVSAFLSGLLSGS
jgi:hypothetical protein